MLDAEKTNQLKDKGQMGNKLQNLKTIYEDLHPWAKKSFRASGNCKSQMFCVLLKEN